MEIEQRIAFWAFISFILFCVAFGVFVIVQSARSTGEVDYCYINSYGADGIKIYKVYGHRNWRTDNVLTTVTEFEDAVEAVGQINCPLMKK